jgi:release factor glutamine methyltransferase
VRTAVREVLNWATEELEERGIETARLDAEVMLACLLDKDRSDLYRDYGERLGEDVFSRYKQWVRRRQAREPVAYITGIREFWSIPLKVDRGVLIPRPETEVLVAHALEALASIAGKEIPAILEIGTGSGAISVALAREFPRASIMATDRSRTSLDVARSNARLYGVDEKITFLAGDLLGPISVARASFDLLVANLPYVPSGELSRLQPEVALYEPPLALCGGEDGLDLYRALIPAAFSCIVPGGWLMLEVGNGQAEAVASMIKATRRFSAAAIGEDLSGIARVVKARRLPTLEVKG